MHSDKTAESREKNAPSGNAQSSAPALSLPKGGGAIRGIGEKFQVNPSNGTASFSLPLPLPQARSGFGPALALGYDSGAGNGLFGLGWNLGAPSITRKTDQGLPRYDDDADTFLLSGAEDLVPVRIEEVERDGFVVRRYRPRIEGLFARIERWREVATGDTFWRSISKDNVTTFYGRTAAARIADPDDPARIFAWLICESFDDKGNAIVYRYRGEDGAGVEAARPEERHRLADAQVRSAAGRPAFAQRYLDRVRYGNRTPQAPGATAAQLDAESWCFEIVLDYGGHDALGAAVPPAVESTAWPVRADPFSSGRAGFEVRTWRLCRRVLIFHRFPELGAGLLPVRAIELLHAPSPVASTVRSIVQHGYRRRADGSWVVRALPPLEFSYSAAIVHDTVRELSAGALENLPAGLAEGAGGQWVDVEGEGLSGVLTAHAGAWYFQRNLSPINLHREQGREVARPRFGPAVCLAAQPALTVAGRYQFLDLAGDGRPDVTLLDRPLAGFYERTEEETWDDFRAFESVPNVDWNDANLRFIDLTGDGHADVMITEDEVVNWHPSLGERGFGAAVRCRRPDDEERGPALVFADPEQAIHLADMSGDGLSDIVRIRPGEICYWANLGYGRFAKKVTMSHAPTFEEPDQFDPRRLRLADIDGSGVTDLIYLGRDGVRLYFNQSGNAWSAARYVPAFPRIDQLASVQAIDLLGNGTACLVWSSPLPGEAHAPLRYLDLMGGQKPHLLTGVKNNLGAETRIHYAPSTKFYLQDWLAGGPWATRLPFPVQVAERVETLDHISRNRFTTRYTYHHGCFDGPEREFRGFGMVEQQDSEEISALAGDDIDFAAANLDPASHVPPVVTKTWFHTGAWVRGGRISRQYEKEYWREPGLTEIQAAALLLADTILPAGLTPDEEREACRALKGAVLRQEVYALDGSPRAAFPFTVSERNYTIETVQRRGPNAHAVFFTHARETIEAHYERVPADPRVSHSLVLAVDSFGNVLASAAIGYGRRIADASLGADDRAQQAKTHATTDANRFTNAVDEPDAWRTPLLCEARTFELTGPALTGPVRLSFEAVREAVASAAEIPYEAVASPLVAQRRCLEHTRTYFRSDDLSSRLPLGVFEPLALPFASAKLAFTPALVARIFAGRVSDVMLSGEAGFVHSEGDANWWHPSGRVFFSADPAATAVQELAEARAHFFLPRRFRDAFGNESTVRYDAHDLLPVDSEDAAHNRITVGERDLATGALLANGNDYRVLQPALITDANGNRAAASFDALGLVAGTAIMGKRGEAAANGTPLGDTLAGFEPDLTDAQLIAFFAQPRWQPGDPAAPAPVLLAGATSRVLYDVRRFHRAGGDPGRPVFSATLSRERHGSDLGAGEESPIQTSFSYSDGFGREIQKKIQAEPGPVVEDGPAVSPRWVGSGWTIFNNKGQPARQYEPFFTAAHEFEFDRRHGVSPVLFYDPPGRVIATLSPDRSYGKVVFDPWKQSTWDGNDTVLLDPRTDPDVSGFTAAYFAAEPLGQTWHAARALGALGTEEQAAAVKAAAHAGTCTVVHFDSLGRPFLTVADNGVAGRYATRVELDLEGNQRAVLDALDRVVMRYDYDLLGHRLRQESMDAGTRWTLLDLAGQPVRAFDSRGFVRRFTHDALRRPVGLFVTDAATGVEILAGRTVYGDDPALAPVFAPQPAERTNHRGKPYQVFDGAGVVTSEAYDFKGHLLSATRRLVRDYTRHPNWSPVAAPPPLEPETYTTATTYDALNRTVTATTPDGAVARHFFNEANLLERLEARLPGDAAPTVFVQNIDYNARGQRDRLVLGNGVVTVFTYDPETFRLRRLFTRRSGHPDPARHVLQNLHYFYDPVGNVTRIRDSAQQPVFFNNAVSEPHQDFTCDALYRLIEATGREHIGQAGTPVVPEWDDAFRTGHPHPHDGRAMRPYTERYEYDPAGNFQRMIHIAANGHWTREYAYASASLLEPALPNNRLTATQTGAIGQPYTYDAHGNMTAMPHLGEMRWDMDNQLQMVSLGGGGRAWYQYDAAGGRVRKVIERQNGTRAEERRYLGSWETYRRYDGSGAGVALERESLHAMASGGRVALVETLVSDAAPRLVRYHLGNQLGSVAIEVDASDEAQVISHEEFYPYGASSFRAQRSALEAPNRYRYTGLERDEESGLGYHAARYYAPWLGRWTAADKLMIRDGPNVYLYAAANPILVTDKTGNYGEGGHYYTVYFASLAAGFDPETASRNAAFAQMPDEVKALDAIEQQISRVTAQGGMVGWTTAERDLIQRGLHSLTGGSSSTERRLTREALTQTTPGTLAFGFLLHRLGDTYAHSVRGNEGAMYETGFGHMRHGHTPDQIHMRPQLYATYVRDLFGTLSESAQAQGRTPRITQEELERFSNEISSISVTRTHRLRDPETHEFEEIEILDLEATEAAQIQRIRELSEQLMPETLFQESAVGPPTVEQTQQAPVGRMRPYAPEHEDTMSWAAYQRRHGDLVSGTSWSDVAGAVHSAARQVNQDRDVPLRPR